MRVICGCRVATELAGQEATIFYCNLHKNAAETVQVLVDVATWFDHMANQGTLDATQNLRGHIKRVLQLHSLA